MSEAHPWRALEVAASLKATTQKTDFRRIYGAIWQKEKSGTLCPAQQTNPEDDIQVMGGDADETDIEDGGGQVIDFDAIADELGDDDGESAMGDPLGDGTTAAAIPQTATATTDETAFDLSDQGEDDIFGQTPGFETTGAQANADDELDFDTVFDDGSAPGDATGEAASPAAPATDENPFGAATANVVSGAPAIEPVVAGDALTENAPPLTHTPPMTTADMVSNGHAPVAKKSLPLLPLLGAAGLLAGLGVVGWLFLGPKPPADDVAIATNPGVQAPADGNMTGNVVPAGSGVTPAGSGIVPAGSGIPVDATSPGIAPVSASGAPVANQGIAVDGVPIAPGIVVRNATGAESQLQNQLKALWNQGAAAKRAKNYAAARAAWQEILRLDPGHKGIQEAINKLPGHSFQETGDRRCAFATPVSLSPETYLLTTDEMFISFEGIDGCGKTTQLNRLRARLEARGTAVVSTREPGGTALAESLRETLLHGGDIEARAELLLFGAARAQHVREIIRPALERGAWVLCDRFIDSSEAYQGGGLGLDREFIRAMNAFATDGLTPNRTIFVDVTPSSGASRRAASRAGADRIEARGDEFGAKVRAVYLDIAARDSQRVIRVDGAPAPDEVEATIWASLSFGGE